MASADIYLVEIRYVKLYMVYTFIQLGIYQHIPHIQHFETPIKFRTKPKRFKHLRRTLADLYRQTVPSKCIDIDPTGRLVHTQKIDSSLLVGCLLK